MGFSHNNVAPRSAHFYEPDTDQGCRSFVGSCFELPRPWRGRWEASKGSNIRHAHISKWVAFVQRAATTHDALLCPINQCKLRYNSASRRREEKKASGCLAAFVSLPLLNVSCQLAVGASSEEAGSTLRLGRIQGLSATPFSGHLAGSSD